MNREIKFRFRVKIPGGFYDRDSPERVDVVFATLDELLEGTAADILHHSLVTILSRDEWSGLQDTHGKDIYESDICSTQNSMLPQTITYQGDIGYPAFDLAPGWEDDLNHVSREWHEGTLEVIGNIYDNTELTEGGDQCKKSNNQNAN